MNKFNGVHNHEPTNKATSRPSEMEYEFLKITIIILNELFEKTTTQLNSTIKPNFE